MRVASLSKQAQLKELQASECGIQTTMCIEAPELLVESYELSAATTHAVSVIIKSSTLERIHAYQFACNHKLRCITVHTVHPFCVGSCAFLGCSALQNVDLKGCIAIGNLCFAKCTGLLRVRISPPPGADVAYGIQCFLRSSVNVNSAMCRSRSL